MNETVDEMRAHWKAFAAENAMFYIAAEREDWTFDEFKATGKPIVDDLVEWIGPAASRQSALEIGCGLGRLLHHLADHFERVVGVDISPEMIEQAVAFGLPGNVEVEVANGKDLGRRGEAEQDVIVSFLVFQHIPDESIVAGYLREIERVLKPAGKAVLQFDTRPSRAFRRGLLRLPDKLLPRTNRRFIRRYPLPDPRDS